MMLLQHPPPPPHLTARGSPKVKTRAKGKANRLRVNPGHLVRASQRAKVNMARGVRKEKGWLKVTRAPGYFPKNDRILSCMEPALQAH